MVDDAPSMRLLCRVNLELEGYRVLEAGALDTARDLIESEPVAVVLLDLHIGPERGDMLLEEIRRREPRIAVAVMTGSVEIESGDLRIDADAVLPKPFTIDALIATVRALATGSPITS